MNDFYRIKASAKPYKMKFVVELPFSMLYLNDIDIDNMEATLFLL